MIPRHRPGRHCAARTLGLGLLLAGVMVAGLAAAAPAQSSGALVEVIEIEGVIDRTVADYTVERIAAAEASDLVVISLDTPGGLGVDVGRLTEAVVTSEVPVAVWVGPSGARASGAGMHLAYAAHVLAMAPSTTLGPAAPVDLAAPDAEVAAAGTRLEQLARLRGRDADFAVAASTDDAVVAIGDAETLPDDVRLPAGVEAEDVTVVSEAALTQHPVADFVADGLPAVMTALDGREVELTPAGGSTTTTVQIDQATANVRFNNLGLLRRILHTAANPTLAYLLIIGGALSLLFEVFQPGFGVAGVTGLALIALGLYGLTVLPISWLAFALIVVGLALLAVDLAIAGLGIPTAAGTAALAAGSFLLFDGAAVLRVSPWVIVPVVVFTVIFFVVIMTTVLRAQGNQAMAGAEGLAGRVGVVRSMLNPEGHIFVSGALWRARAPESAGKVRTGTKVRVLGINDRLTLDVEVIDSDDSDRTPVG